jgi:putative heme-binding domain-containing protein
VQLATEKRQRLQLSADVLQKLAQNDPSPTVRLALAAALPMFPSATRWQVGGVLAQHDEDAEDRFLPKMVWYGIADLTTTDVPRAMDLAESSPLGVLADSMYWYLARHPEGRNSLVEAITATSDDEQAKRLLVLLHHGVQSESKLSMPENWGEVRRRFANSANANLQTKADELSALFGDHETLAKYRTILADKSASLASRRKALRLLKRVGDHEAAPIYVQLLDDAALREDAIELVPMIPGNIAASKLIDVFPELNESERTAALHALTSRADFASALLQAVENRSFDKKHLSALHIRQMSNIGSEELNRRLENVWGKVTASSADTKSAIERLKKTYSTAPLWAFDHRRGRQVFERTCAACHPLDGSTTPLGPSLVGSWRNGLDYFVENIIDPNAVVGESFRTTVIVTVSGTVVSGMLDRETESAVVIRTAEERIVVPNEEIESRRLESQSIMPTAILETLTEVEKIELLKFLTTEPR